MWQLFNVGAINQLASDREIRITWTQDPDLLLSDSSTKHITKTKMSKNFKFRHLEYLLLLLANAVALWLF